MTRITLTSFDVSLASSAATMTGVETPWLTAAGTGAGAGTRP